MSEILASAGAALALIASGVGVLLAIDQLTLRARLRKTVETASTLAAPETGEREVILRSIHDVAVARLTAGWLVPGWRFGHTIGWLLAAPLAVGFAARVEGFTWEILAFTTLVFVALTITNRQGLGLMLERQRIGREYLAGLKVEPPRTGTAYFQAGGGTFEEYLFAALGSLGPVLLALGAGGQAHDPQTSWRSLLLVFFGFFAASLALDFVRSRAIRPAVDP